MSSGLRRRNGRNRIEAVSQAEKRTRQDLLSQSRSNNKSSRCDATASEAKKIQQSLMKTQNLLKNELHRITHISSAIEEDETVLQQTMDHHKSLNTKQAQKALLALQRAQQQEQRVLTASIIFFCFTVLYIMWSRVLIKFDFVSVVLNWIV